MSKVTRKRAKRGEGDKLRHEILEVADRLLLEAGSEDAVSIQMIADGVGCTPPAIYMHFADKDALMREVCVQHFESFVAALVNAGDDGDDPFEPLMTRGRAYLEFGLQHPEVYRILFMQQPAGQAVRDVSASPADFFALLAPAVESCIESGVFADRDPFVLACGLWASIHGLTSLMIANPEFPWPPLEDIFVFEVMAPVANAAPPPARR
jgi:AcrR family transcriptional regulator